jgi:glycosyltransferase involved in cell wall biosynthesis
MAQPIVSIVMPTFNRLEFLQLTVRSVFRQTLQDWELLIADDGSTEDVLAYLETLEKDERVRLLRRPHLGNPGAVRNAAIAVARGSFLAFIDSDDLWVENKLERQLAAMRGNPQCGWSYTAFTIVDAKGAPLSSERNRPWTPYGGDIFVEAVRTTASIRLPSVLARTELVREVGGFDNAIECAEDSDLWMRLALRSPICVVDESLVHVRRHAGNTRRAVGTIHVARDYSLRKLARQVTGAQRALLAEERSRNALQMAAALSAAGSRWRSVVVVAKSLRYSWRYPRWWYGSVRALARVFRLSVRR